VKSADTVRAHHNATSATSKNEHDEVRRARGLTQQQVADRTGVAKGRVSQIERGEVSGHDVLARHATALGGQLHQAIYFDDGDITAIAETASQGAAVLVVSDTKMQVTS